METLITLWIIGAVMVALIGALFTMTRTSDVNRKTAEAESEMRDLEAAVRAAPYKTKATNGNVCPTSATYTSNYTTKPTYATVNATTVSWWDGSMDPLKDVPNLSSAHLSSSCNSDFGIQVFTLSLTVGPAPTVTVTQLNFIKRDNGSN